MRVSLAIIAATWLLPLAFPLAIWLGPGRVHYDWVLQTDAYDNPTFAYVTGLIDTILEPGLLAPSMIVMYLAMMIIAYKHNRYQRLSGQIEISWVSRACC